MKYAFLIFVILIGSAEFLGAAQRQDPAEARFEKLVNDRIAQVWFRSARSIRGADASLYAGTVKIGCEIAPNGQIKDIKVLSRTPKKHLTTLAISTLRAVKLPPIPADVRRTLPRGVLACDFQFTCTE